MEARLLVHCCILGALLLVGPLQGQPKSVEDVIAEGVRSHDAGDYEGAIKAYEEALALEPQSVVALYEIALTYSALKDYSRCRFLCQGGAQWTDTGSANRACLRRGGLLSFSRRDAEAGAAELPQGLGEDSE